MAQQKNTSLVEEFQKVLLDDKDFLKNLLFENLQSLLQTVFDHFIKAGPYLKIPAILLTHSGLFRLAGHYNSGLIRTAIPDIFQTLREDVFALTGFPLFSLL